MLAYSAKVGERITLARFGEEVAKAERRAKPYKASTVADWIAERNEPTLAAFLAMERVLGVPASYLAFGVDATGEEEVPVPRPQPQAAPTKRAADGGRGR